MAFDIGEAEVAALVAIGEFLVIDPEEMKEGGLEIVDADRVAGDAVSELIGFPMDVAGFEATAGGPDGVALAEVVAAVPGLADIALNEDGAAEFAPALVSAQP